VSAPRGVVARLPPPFCLVFVGDFLDAPKARLGDILEDIGTKKLVYLYDFGDGWTHTINIERLARSRAGATLSAPHRSRRPLPRAVHARVREETIGAAPNASVEVFEKAVDSRLN
jgi:Plasmid pRiA4b ORF-3-like protein